MMSKFEIINLGRYLGIEDLGNDKFRLSYNNLIWEVKIKEKKEAKKHDSKER